MHIRFETVPVAKLTSEMIEILVKIVGESWQSPAEFLKAELGDVEKILLGKDQNKSILGFCCWRVHQIDHPDFDAGVYIGLCAVSSSNKGKGVGHNIASEGVKSAISNLRERFCHSNDSRLFAYVTTNSPISFRWYQKYFPKNFSPDSDGNLNQKWISLVPELVKTLDKAPQNENDHPAIMRDINSCAFRNEETIKLRNMLRENRLIVFSKYGIDPGGKDQILMTFDVDQVT